MAKRFIICTGFLFLNFSITVFAQSSLTNLLQSLIEKEQKYQILEDSLTAVQKNNDQDNPNNQTTNLLENLKAEKSKIHRELLSVKSEILESEKPEPVWVEGEGEIVLDEKKPFEQSRRLVLMFARRDAMEKGSTLIVETLTSLKQFEVNAEKGSGIESKFVEEYKSIIQSKGKVEVVDQDLSGDYGKIITVEEDGMKKLKTKVRMKISSINGINPFKEELGTSK